MTVAAKNQEGDGRSTDGASAMEDKKSIGSLHGASLQQALAEVRNMPLIEPKLLHTVVEKYEGESKDNGLPHGHGTAYLRAGHKYTGSFFMGYMHGRGRYEWTDGLVYEGDMSWGTINGVGTYTWPNGTTYTGDIVDGLCHGVGQQQLGGGMVVYDGQWARGVRHGQGTVIFLGEKGCQYSGQWEDDAKSGEGMMVHRSGNWYEGQWRDDKKCGDGMMVWATRGEQYSGTWQRDLPEGFGEYIWWLRVPRAKIRASQVQQCNRYVGEFHSGKRHGYGRFFYANGAYYEGEWQDNVRHGRGVFIFEDGTVVSSIWTGGKPEVPIHECRPHSSDPKVMIDDLIEECANEDPAQTRKAVGAVLLRFMSELRHAYDHYSALPVPGLIEPQHLGFGVEQEEPEAGEEPHEEDRFSEELFQDAENNNHAFEPRQPNPANPKEGIWWSGRPSFQLLMCQLHIMLRDCSLPNQILTSACINRLASKALRYNPAILRLREELTAKGYDVPHEDDPEVHTHDPVRELSFRAFCELIVRIAAVLNQHMPTLERRVHALISQRMVPMIDALNSSGPLVQHPAKQIMEVPGVREALEELDDHLYELFEHARATEYAGLPKSRPATAPGRPGHKLSPLPNEASKASISKEAGGEVWYGSDAVLTVRQLLLLLVRRGLVKGTPQHRKSPPPPEPVEPSQTSIKDEGSAPKKDAKDSKGQKGKVPKEVVSEPSVPEPPAPPPIEWVQDCGITVGAVVHACMLVACPAEATHSVALGEDGALVEEDIDPAQPFQDLLASEVELLQGEFVELITLLASRAISHPLLSMRDKIRSFVLGGLLGWEEEGAEYPPRVPQEEMSGGLGEDSMFDSEIQQESSDAMTNDSLID